MERKPEGSIEIYGEKIYIRKLWRCMKQISWHINPQKKEAMVYGNIETGY